MAFYLNDQPSIGRFSSVETTRARKSEEDEKETELSVSRAQTQKSFSRLPRKVARFAFATISLKRILPSNVSIYEEKVQYFNIDTLKSKATSLQRVETLCLT